MKYIMKHIARPSGCVFCNAQKEEDGAQNLILKRNQLCYVIINRYPYTSGHVMVVPFQHVASIEEMDVNSRAEMMELINESMHVLRKVYCPEGFNLGANIGLAAGAGVAEHVHFHIVPRWNGDTNFFSTVGNIRILPEELDETYRRLKEAWG